MPEAREADIDRAVAAARAAFDDGPWPRMPRGRARRRDGAPARRAAGARRPRWRPRITDEMGSPISFSQHGPGDGVEHGARLLRPPGARVCRSRRCATACSVRRIVRREPVGVVAAIVPWNVPQFTIMLKLGPALAAGATVVVKPAPETPLDCHPAGRGDSRRRAAHGRREHRRRRARGRRVPGAPPRRRQGRLHRQHRGRPPHRRRSAASSSSACTLELGGKSAAIILDDADLDIDHLRPAARRDHEQRPGLRGADARPGVAHAATARSSRRWRRRRGAVAVGDPARSEHGVRPAGRGAPARARRGLHPHRPRGRRARRRRRRPPGGLSSRAGTSSRRCSSTSTTACASRARRSSARCCR